MALVVLPYSLSAHTDAKAAEVMADYNAILAQLNGNIDAENIAEGGVETKNLAAGAITSEVLAPTAGILTTEGGTMWAGSIGDLNGFNFTVKPTVKSRLFVFGQVAYTLTANNESFPGEVKFQLTVGGVAKHTWQDPLPGGFYAQSHAINFPVQTLEAGEHEVKVRGGEYTSTAVALGSSSFFNYLLVAY